MELEKMELHQKMMLQMKRDFGNIYFEMFGNCILEGMPIEVAIWHCWNNLMCK
jgi:hypothetical protein